ncbi:hypothetical protein ACP70R_007983 [Stipagrostis hirtigluma subsp. patula]
MPGVLKSSWPEVVDKPDHVAIPIIHRDRPDVYTQVIKLGERVEPGTDNKRVRVFVHNDEELTVAREPVIG